jgi:hypothetical protein
LKVGFLSLQHHKYFKIVELDLCVIVISFHYTVVYDRCWKMIKNVLKEKEENETQEENTRFGFTI